MTFHDLFKKYSKIFLLLVVCLMLYAKNTPCWSKLTKLY